MSSELTTLATLIAMIVLIVMQRRDAAKAEATALANKEASEQRNKQVKEEIAKVGDAATTSAKEVKIDLAAAVEKSQAIGARQEQKLDDVHGLVNGSMTEIKEKLASALGENAGLKEAVKAKVEPCP